LESDPHYSEQLDPDPHRNQNSEALEAQNIANGGSWTLTIEAWMLKMESCRVYRPVVEDSHHFDEEQDTDTDPHPHDPHLIEKLEPDPH
jgi:hypothetical protein